MERKIDWETRCKDLIEYLSLPERVSAYKFLSENTDEITRASLGETPMNVERLARQFDEVSVIVRINYKDSKKSDELQDYIRELTLPRSIT